MPNIHNPRFRGRLLTDLQVELLLDMEPGAWYTAHSLRPEQSGGVDERVRNALMGLAARGVLRKQAGPVTNRYRLSTEGEGLWLALQVESIEMEGKKDAS